MKKGLVFLLMIFCFLAKVEAQCSLCTKTAAQLGEKPALGLNNAIIYMIMIPFVIMGYLGYRWWQSEKSRHAG